MHISPHVRREAQGRFPQNRSWRNERPAQKGLFDCLPKGEVVVVSVAQIESKMFLIRGQKVMLSQHLAALYEVEPKILNQAVKRNIERFPEDFMFQLTEEETALLRSQIVTLKTGRGQHSKYLPYAFTEQGVAMLSSVLRSERAIQVNIEIMRAFVRLRQMLATLSSTLSRLRARVKTKRLAHFIFDAELARKLAALEKKYDARFKAVFEAIHALMTPPENKKKRHIGFATWDNQRLGSLLP